MARWYLERPGGMEELGEGQGAVLTRHADRGIVLSAETGRERERLLALGCLQTPCIAQTIMTS